MSTTQSQTLPYSFHLSKGNNALSTSQKVKRASEHNLRAYGSSDYDKNQIEVLVGSSTSFFNDIKDIYDREFGPSLKRYNSKHRKDRQIKDYLKHMSDSKYDCACELIIQLGDRDYWRRYDFEDIKPQINQFYKEQLHSFMEKVPEFKVASAVIHYDESSPHMQIVGVPIASGYKTGLEKRCSKRKVFTKERLISLQTEMRMAAQETLNNLNMDIIICAPTKGRNKDIPKEALSEYNRILKEIKWLKKEKNRIQQDISKLTDSSITTHTIMNDGLVTFPLPELRRRNKALLEENKRLTEENKKLEKRNLRFIENDLTEDVLKDIICDETTEQLLMAFTPILLKDLEDKGFLNQKASEVINKIDIYYCFNKMLQYSKDFLGKIKEKIINDRIIYKEDNYEEEHDL